jgi:hypothetical protein
MATILHRAPSLTPDGYNTLAVEEISDAVVARASAYKSPTEHDIGAVVVVPGGLAAFLGEASFEASCSKRFIAR